MTAMHEAGRLYQAALEDRRARRAEVGDGYQTAEERAGLGHIDAEIERSYDQLFHTWLGNS